MDGGGNKIAEIRRSIYVNARLNRADHRNFVWSRRKKSPKADPVSVAPGGLANPIFFDAVYSFPRCP
jgi:hypothetical protein